MYALSAPAIASNANGEIVVIFEYFDPNTAYQLCAAGMLPSGTTT